MQRLQRGWCSLLCLHRHVADVAGGQKGFTVAARRGTDTNWDSHVAARVRFDGSAEVLESIHARDTHTELDVLNDDCATRTPPFLALHQLRRSLGLIEMVRATPYFALWSLTRAGRLPILSERNLQVWEYLQERAPARRPETRRVWQ